MRMTLLKVTPLFVAAALLHPNTSIAADAVIEEAPAPPEPVVEAPAPSGAYIAARIGGAFAEDTDFNTLGTNVTNGYDTGYNVSGAFGYAFPSDSALTFRTEGEIGYQANDIDGHNVAGVGSFSGAAASGEATALYGLANGYVDYELGILTPFITAGVGYARVEFDNFGTTPTGQVLNDSGNGLAWQIGAGTGVALTDNVTLDLGYRYLGIEDVEVTANDATQSELDLRTHQINVGLRTQF